MGAFNYWELLAGVGILTFGMRVFESAIKVLGGNKLKSILKRFTKTGWSAIFTGFWTTSVLQSSTLLSLLTLAFAGAGILALKNAIGLIFGANIGSPVLPLLAAFIGFGEFDISAFALPIIAVGGISLIFVQSEKWQNVAKLLIGFGLLFLGIDFMKGSVDALKDQFGLEQFADLSLWGFGLLGVIVTIMMSSSGALGIVTLAALNSGLIDFPSSVAIGMGANIGTTFPAVIASLGGSRVKKQIAATHVLFNVLSAVIGVALFWQYIWFTNEVLGFRDNPVMGNAVLNVVFNASTAIFFGFFIGHFTKLVERIVPEKKDQETRLKILEATIAGHKKDTDFAGAQLYALHEDGKVLIDHAALYNAYLFGRDMKNIHEGKNEKTDIKSVSRDKAKHKEMYMEAKRISDIMFEHLLPIQQEKLPKDARKVSEHVETTIYSATKSIKSIKNIYRDIQNLKDAESTTLQDIYTTFSEQAKEFYIHVAHITDREYNKENFRELKVALEKIEGYHRTFVDMITKLINKKTDLEEIDIPSLINVDHYIYQSAKTMVKALQNTYLTEEEEKEFEELAEGEKE